MELPIKAVGAHIILKGTPAMTGDAETSQGGIFLGTREHGEVPEMLEIYSIGDTVPEGIFEIGDLTATPKGNMREVIHPLVALGLKKNSEVREKFVSVHHTALSVLYK